MDIILEVIDTFVFDRVYATILPATLSSPVTQFLSNATTSTFSSLREGATAAPQPQWTYTPATSLFQLEPSKWAYASALSRDNIYRQGVSLFFITWIFGVIFYFLFASLSYWFVFDHDTFKHPKFLKNQVKLEIIQANKAMPLMAILTAACFLGEVRGYAKLFDSSADAPFPAYVWLQFPLFILFTDCFIYWIHRGLHHPLVYKRLHKPHHKWIMPTPFASHAFHPLDGFAQSIPYHVYPFLFPLQKFAYIALFVFINLWTIFIHDGEFDFNYGQFTTLWDRLGGSYLRPPPEMFQKDKGSKKE